MFCLLTQKILLVLVVGETHRPCVGWESSLWPKQSHFEALAHSESLLWQMWLVIISAIKTFSSPLTFTPLKETGTDTVHTIRAISSPVIISTVILWAPITPYRLSRRTHNYLFVYFNKEASECSSLKHTCTHSNTRKIAQNRNNDIVPFTWYN